MEQRLSAIHGFTPGSHRLSASSGIVAVVLLVIAFAILGTDFPTYDDTPDKFAKYYADNTDTVELSNLLFIFGTAAFVWFAGFLRWSYGTAEQVARGFQRATPTAFGAAIAGSALAVVYAAAHQAASVSQGLASPGAVRAFDLMGVYVLTIAGVLFSVFLLASFFLIRVTSVLPGWLGWLAMGGTVLGAVQAILLLAPSDDDGPLGIIGFVWFLAFLVWTLGASITLVRRTT
jgi:hypothetical protein